MAVLIVDDCASTRQALRSILELKGYPDVLCAASGAEALELLIRQGPATAVEVVLVDVLMPEMDGIEFCRRLKENLHLRDIPVLVVTGVPQEQVIEKAFAAGACDYITKPVYLPELLARIRSALNLKRELDSCKASKDELEQVTQQLRKLNEELQRLAILDELTGIANRRFFNLVLAQEWARAAREVQPLGLILIDIDFFKDYNDHFGHLRGDRCLRQVAETLSAQTKRPSDHVARYGGEEFAVLMPHTSLEGAGLVAEWLRRQVEELQIEHPGSRVHDRVTISLGVAVGLPSRRSSADALLAAADLAVYQAKHEGRNRVKMFERIIDQVPGHFNNSPAQPRGGMSPGSAVSVPAPADFATESGMMTMRSSENVNMTDSRSNPC